jgi:hypothetical protein
MKPIIVGALLALALASPAFAQAPAATAEFKCPAVGTVFTYIAAGIAGGAETHTTATGQDGSVCLFSRAAAGKAETLRIHWGLIGSVDPQGEAFANGIDMKSLWPLKVGNKTSGAVTVTRGIMNFTSTITMEVVAYEKVTVPAGTFDAFRVEENKAGEATRNIHWWAPALSQSVKESFPDWRELSKTIVLELASVRPASK